MFTTRFTKANGKAPPLANRFAEGGEVPLPTADPRGNDYRKGQRRVAIESEGASGRSFGEHAKAMVRAIWEPQEFRNIYDAAGKRDRTNVLYDRKKLPEDQE